MHAHNVAILHVSNMNMYVCSTLTLPHAVNCIYLQV